MSGWASPGELVKGGKPRRRRPSGYNRDEPPRRLGAGLIEREIFGRSRDALVTYGNFHFATDPATIARIPVGPAWVLRSKASILARYSGSNLYGSCHQGL